MFDISLLEHIARAGGGGSSSGGGGGGGGSISDLIFLITFFFSGWIARFFKKTLPRQEALAVTIVGGLVCSLLIIIFFASFNVGFFSWYVGFLLILGIWIGWYSVMFGVWEKMRKRFKKADQAIEIASQTDPIWNQETMVATAQEIFLRYQDDWSRRDSSRFDEYMTPTYAQHVHLMIRALSEMHRKNIMNEINILNIDISSALDQPGTNQDSFRALIGAQAQDNLFDETSQTYLHTDNSSFIEEWTFARKDQSWYLAGIRQITEDRSYLESSLKMFAYQHQMFYSLDWGRLLLPNRGQLFKTGSFSKSDINNHVIGLYNNLLVQLYTYRNLPSTNADVKNYLIGQINLPKTYGGIIIKRKKNFFDNFAAAPAGYRKYEYEWPDFNKRYTVYATDMDRLAAFELINPSFMAFLYDTFDDINIEVVDNLVYFYTEKYSQSSDYEQLLQILVRAFKELQL